MAEISSRDQAPWQQHNHEAMCSYMMPHISSTEACTILCAVWEAEQEHAGKNTIMGLCALIYMMPHSPSTEACTILCAVWEAEQAQAKGKISSQPGIHICNEEAAALLACFCLQWMTWTLILRLETLLVQCGRQRRRKQGQGQQPAWQPRWARPWKSQQMRLIPW